ncbi:uncharacterized protein METZ01_LOCUS451098, partial [marine metagenome]
IRIVDELADFLLNRKFSLIINRYTAGKGKNN